jgi:hypothetical protein
MQFSHQESLDMSSIGLIRQGRPGFSRDEVGDVGCRFAAGCAAAQLLPPEVDRVAIDRNLGSQSANGPVVAPLLRAAGHDPEFVYRLQVVHDRTVAAGRGSTLDGFDLGLWRRYWLERLRDLVRDHGLDLSKVEQAARDAGWEVV